MGRKTDTRRSSQSQTNTVTGELMKVHSFSISVSVECQRSGVSDLQAIGVYNVTTDKRDHRGVTGLVPNEIKARETYSSHAPAAGVCVHHTYACVPYRKQVKVSDSTARHTFQHHLTSHHTHNSSLAVLTSLAD